MLRVHITPADAVNAAARWRCQGVTDWLNSGEDCDGIPVGIHSIEFAEIAHWSKPDSVLVEVREGQLSEVHAHYSLAGDMDSDGTVNNRDFFLLMQNWQRSEQGP
jgi:hypothetical protein